MSKKQKRLEFKFELYGITYEKWACDDGSYEFRMEQNIPQQLYEERFKLYKEKSESLKHLEIKK